MSKAKKWYSKKENAILLDFKELFKYSAIIIQHCFVEYK